VDGLAFERAFDAEIRLFKNAFNGVNVDDVIASMILKTGDAVDLQLREQLLAGKIRALGPLDDDVDGPGDVVLIEQ
jgi:hypothetical protein